MEATHEATLRSEQRTGAGAEAIGRAGGARPPDLTEGQIVPIIARWVLIGAGFGIALWNPSERDLGALKIALLILFGLAISNFAMHAHILMRRPLSVSLLYGFSAADLAAVTAMVWLFGGGVDSPLFVFYYPALLALALVFPISVAGLFTIGLVLLYAAVGLSLHASAGDQQLFVAHVISLVAVAVIGTLYQHIEEDRRRAERSATAPRQIDHRTV